MALKDRRPRNPLVRVGHGPAKRSARLKLKVERQTLCSESTAAMEVAGSLGFIVRAKAVETGPSKIFVVAAIARPVAAFNLKTTDSDRPCPHSQI